MTAAPETKRRRDIDMLSEELERPEHIARLRRIRDILSRIEPAPKHPRRLPPQDATDRKH